MRAGPEVGPDVRPPAVAGLFYPAAPSRLERTVDELLSRAEEPVPPPVGLEAVIVPHAGYLYSGPVAASAYRAVAARSEPITRVVLVGPAHRVPFHGLALPTVERFATPLGTVAVDRVAAPRLLELPGVQMRDDAHAGEHSLEVQLPFLQRVLPGVPIVPIVVGLAPAEWVAAALDAAWNGETLVVVSSDLSHELPYAEAGRIDRATARAIERLDMDAIGAERACGSVPIAGLLRAARARGLTCRVARLQNSGDTAGPRYRVVGYGAFLFERPDGREDRPA